MQDYINIPKEEIIRLITSDMKKDLHIHTCYSDGTLRPEEVVDRWQEEGYELISITDHDGIEGSLIGMDYAAGKKIMFVRGIEFDSSDCDGKDLHILGYGYDYACEELRTALLNILLNRARRNDRMMAALNKKGFGITLDDIGRINEGRFVGKPTFARILVQKGFALTQQAVFNTIFRDEDIRSIQKVTLESKEVIDLIHKASGVAVLAHPMEQRNLGESFEDFLPRLYNMLDRFVSYGVDGIECYHPSASEKQAKLLREYAEAHGLIITEGSDFHADGKPRDFTRYTCE